MDQLDNSKDIAATQPPPAVRKQRRWWVRVLINLAIIYTAWCLTLYFYQDHLLFPADLAPEPYPGAKYDISTTVLTRTLPEGGEVVAWLIPPAPRFRDKPAPLVVFCHGNAEIIDDQSFIISGYQLLGFAILLPEYRGYGRSAGSPTEAGLVDDAVYFLDQVLDRPEIDAGRIVLHGRSLGGGVAAGLADRRKPSALILQSTFTSVASMASSYFAPAFLVKNPFRVDRVLETLDVPVLIFHGADDEIIPVKHGRRLRDVAMQATYHEYNCRHNDFPGDANEATHWKDIENFLREAGILPSHDGGSSGGPGLPAASQSAEAAP